MDLDDLKQVIGNIPGLVFTAKIAKYCYFSNSINQHYVQSD